MSSILERVVDLMDEQAATSKQNVEPVPPPEADAQPQPAEALAPLAAQRQPPPDVVDVEPATAVEPAPAEEPARESAPPTTFPSRPDVHREPDRVATSLVADFGFLNIAGADPDKRSVKEFRHLKRPLLAVAAVPADEAALIPPNVIMVTSSVPNEGKTFVASHLAASIAAEVDRDVLFIDGDTHQRRSTQLAGIDKTTPGFCEALAAHHELRDPVEILDSNIPNLRFLPAGNRPDNLDELMSSPSSRQFIIALAEQTPNSIVIIDTPPLLATSDVHVLISLAGQVVVVVEANRTPHHVAAEALRKLNSHPHVSVVLNKSSRRFSGLASDSHYGYYEYGYS